MSAHHVPIAEAVAAISATAAIEQAKRDRVAAFAQHAAEEADRLGDEREELEAAVQKLTAQVKRLERQLATEHELVATLVRSVDRQVQHVRELLPWAARGARDALPGGPSAAPWGAEYGAAELLDRINRGRYRRGGLQL